MPALPILAVPILALGVLMAVVMSWTLGSLNGLIRLRELVGESWRQVADELDRRHRLIPQLVQTVHAQAPDAADQADAVLAARAQALAPGGLPTRAAAEAGLTEQLGRLFALAGDHPLLAADQDFLALARELRETEDRVVAGRRHYNDAAGTLNTRVGRFPTRLVALAFRVRAAEPFDAGRRAAPSDRTLDPAPPP